MNVADQQFERLAEAEDYCLQAEFILHALQANLQVYGSNSALSGASPANIGLALQYIDRSLEYFPDNPKYLNLKALLLGEGLGKKDQAIALLKKAHEINPRDINVANNLRAFETSKCFIATAAYGTPMSVEVETLRRWRDENLAASWPGQFFILAYYTLSPPIARMISASEFLKAAVRLLLKPLVKRLHRRMESTGS
jgi:tetratricopeptide (TPR) repeat protein